MQSSLFSKIVTSNSFFERMYRSYRKWKKRRVYRNLSNEAIFTSIYAHSVWGMNEENPGAYFSGTGSYGLPAEAYVTMINNFIRNNHINSVTDIGCGDFAIGNKITMANAHLNYNGCDVVKPVIESNRQVFGNERIKFFHLDATTDIFPDAELLTVREVLQHLSNDAIKRILAKAANFKYVIITEHLYPESMVGKKNMDKPTGPDLRLIDQSGVYINHPPFNVQCSEILSCRVDAFGKEAYLKSFLIKNEKEKLSSLS